MNPRFEILTKIFFCSFMFTISISAQNSALTYQGNLQFSGQPANGNYDFEFALFDAAAAGTQLGSTQTVNSVAVTNGSFAVTLDFGSQFPGASRFIEIRVRPAGGGAYTPLAPRQSVASSPYAIRSASASAADTAASATNATNATTAATATNALSLGGVAANQYVLTGDARLSDARPPIAGSANYIQNTATQQASSNFNISGNGTAGGTLSAGVLNATSQITLGGVQAIRRSSSSSIWVGDEEDDSILVAGTPSFFGIGSTSGSTVIGDYFNRVYGYGGGLDGNDYYPRVEGYFGRGSTLLPSPPLADDVLFMVRGVGWRPGGSTWSVRNASMSFVATENWTAGSTGSRIDFDTIIPGTTTSARTLSITNTGLGIRTTTPTADLHIVSNGGNIVLGDAGCPAGSTAIGFNGAFNNCLNYSVRGDGTALYFNRPTGGDILFREENGTTQMRLRSGGVLQLTTLGTAGSTALCRNASSDISTCSSSVRYKDNIGNFESGLDLIRRLRPVTFNWKDDGMLDMGLVAEEVAEIEPLLTTTNDKGETEGVKYDRISVALVNAVKEQQTLIEAQRSEINILKRYICMRDADAPFCKEKK